MKIASPAYVVMIGVTVVSGVGLCLAARRHPGGWIPAADRILALMLLAVTGAWIWTNEVVPHWSAGSDLPFALCDIATLVAAAALWTRAQILVELTWFWGLAGSLQSLLTPDVSAPFPSAEFIEYVVAHAGIVVSAVFLVVGQRIVPSRVAVVRTLAITVAYTCFVGVIDAVTGGDYMYLRSRPSSWSLLSVLGPWPWYIVSAFGVAIVLVLALDAPFRAGRRRASVRDHQKLSV